jgi:transcription termination/antitermination protein NusG
MSVSVNQNWYALYVRSRHEFVTQSELIRKGINNFLPSVKRLSQWKDRRKLVESPLFPGYIFVYIQAYAEEYIRVLKTRGAVNLISLEPGIPAPVSPDEINSLRLLIESGQELDIFPDLKKGTRVRVKKGPLAGAVGTLKDREDQYIFIVNIDLLGRSVGVKIYADDIEAG